jgi:tetratricopeptide (TPR) repeat protein
MTVGPKGRQINPMTKKSATSAGIVRSRPATVAAKVARAATRSKPGPSSRAAKPAPPKKPPAASKKPPSKKPAVAAKKPAAVAKPVVKPVVKPVAKPVVKAVVKPVVKAAVKPVAKPVATAKPAPENAAAKPAAGKAALTKATPRAVAAATAPVAKPAVAKPAVAKPAALAKPVAPVGKLAGKVGKARPTIVAPAPKVPPEDALLEKAQTAVRAGNEEQAERFLEQMIGEFPDDPRGRIYLGNLRRRRGDEKGALDEYGKILRKSPQEPLALWFKAELHLAGKPEPDFAQAVMAYKKIVQAHGRKKDDRSKKFVEEAKKQLRFCEARKLSLQSRRFLASEEPRTIKKGRELLVKALDVYPEDARNHMNLGVAHLLLGEAEPAAKLCQAAIELNPRYARAHLFLGRAFRKLGRLRQAKDAFLKCIDLDRSARDAQEAWNDRKQVEVDMARVRLTLFHALAQRPGLDGEKVALTLAQMKQMVAMLEGDDVAEADLTENAQRQYTLTAYSQRHRYRFYPGPESLVVEHDGKTV